MPTSRRKRMRRQATQIECLACGATRVVKGHGTAETGECPRCRYLGWTYSEGLDGTTRRMIMNGNFGLGSAESSSDGAPARRRQRSA